MARHGSFECIKDVGLSAGLQGGKSRSKKEEMMRENFFGGYWVLPEVSVAIAWRWDFDLWQLGVESGL